MTRIAGLIVAAFVAAALRAAPCDAAANRLVPASPRTYGDVKAQATRYGWTCVSVKGDRAGNGFAYSVGLTSKHLPELGVFATDDVANACKAIDRVVTALLAAGRAPRSGAEVFRNGEGRVVLRAVRRNQFYDLCAFAKRWRDEHHVADARAMQIVVLDPGERMPP